MEPLPGFKLTSWERGYGDMKWSRTSDAPPRPVAAEDALVFCDVYTEEGEPIEEAAVVLKRQVARAEAQDGSSRPPPSSSCTASGSRSRRRARSAITP